eukprot:INCI3654.3.p3 GENE.INCI3654.3~~INCI3654.3.p3  ORF type:complete len:100 (-),score=14.42 INCI3654.3:156-455(-)
MIRVLVDSSVSRGIYTKLRLACAWLAQPDATFLPSSTADILYLKQPLLAKSGAVIGGYIYNLKRMLDDTLLKCQRTSSLGIPLLQMADTWGFGESTAER